MKFVIKTVLPWTVASVIVIIAAFLFQLNIENLGFLELFGVILFIPASLSILCAFLTTATNSTRLRNALIVNMVAVIIFSTVVMIISNTVIREDDVALMASKIQSSDVVRVEYVRAEGTAAIGSYIQTYLTFIAASAIGTFLGNLISRRKAKRSSEHPSIKPDIASEYDEIL